MSNNNSENVSFGKPKATGALFVAPAGTAVPSSAAASLDPAFQNLGYVSDEGLVNNVETDVEDVFAWGGDNVLSDQTTYMEMFTFNLIETNVEVAKLYYGEDNVTVDGDNITIRANSKTLPEIVFVAELVMTGGRVKRIVVERGRIADRSAEISYVDGEPVAYPINLKAFPSSTDGDTHKEYIAAIASS
jgi:hypothetical protein